MKSAPNLEYQEINIDLLQYPMGINTLTLEPKNSIYVLGDLHGNAMKALWFALYKKLVTLPIEEFNKLVQIYKQHYKTYLTQEEWITIKDIFSKIQINKKIRCIL